MKKTILIFISLILLMGSSLPVLAKNIVLETTVNQGDAEDSPIQEMTKMSVVTYSNGSALKDIFPDEALCSHMTTILGTSKDQELTQQMVQTVVNLEVSDLGINNMSGIEKLTSLKTLKANRNNIQFLDLSKNTLLTEVECKDNPSLKEINVKGLEKLIKLDVEKNYIQSLDLSTNTQLSQLDCSRNQIKRLDLRKNKKLHILYSEEGILESVDVTGLEILEFINLRHNKLKDLDLSTNTYLAFLIVGTNQLTTIDTTSHPRIVLIDCPRNNLTSLDLSKNPDLQQLTFYNNNVEKIIFGNNKLTDIVSFSGQYNTIRDLSKEDYNILKDISQRCSFSFHGQRATFSQGIIEAYKNFKTETLPIFSQLKTYSDPIEIDIFLEKPDGTILWNYEAFDNDIKSIEVKGTDIDQVGNYNLYITIVPKNIFSPVAFNENEDEFYNKESFYRYSFEVEGYTVSFDSNGDTAVPPIEKIIINSLIQEPTPPEKTGYIFEGWFKDKNLTFPWNFKTDKVKSNLILYGKWKPEVYDIYFDCNGGTSIPNMKGAYYSYINPPENPKREGYTFVGWYQEKECLNIWDFEKNLIHQETTLYAKWKLNEIMPTQPDNNSQITSTETSILPKTGMNHLYLITMILFLLGSLLYFKNIKIRKK